jgi:hypothetical protein
LAVSFNLLKVIVHTEMEEFQTTVSLRKARLSGEGKAIEEKSLITTVIVSKRRGGSLGKNMQKSRNDQSSVVPKFGESQAISLK